MAQKILLSSFYVLWTVYCVVGIIRNMSHYDFLDWVIVLTITFIPYFIRFAILKRKSRVNTKAVPENKHPIQSIQPNQPCPMHQSNTTKNNTSEISTQSIQHIPNNIIRLLWFLNGPFQNYKPETVTLDFDFGNGIYHTQFRTGAIEPSAIDLRLPIASASEYQPKLGYYPSYEQLSPEGRLTYLNWLKNITEAIDIGYVFIFYYGLERHLLFGDSQSALKVICTLREYHTNHSFLAYSADAILIYALIYNRPDVLGLIDMTQASIETRLFASAIVFHYLTAEDIIAAHRKFLFDNNRYIKGNYELFLSTLKDILMEKYGVHNYPILKDYIQQTKVTFPLVLANYSLLPEQRFLSLLDIGSSPHVQKELYSILKETHESVKIKLRELRKNN